jgi:SET domain-containing protein
VGKTVPLHEVSDDLRAIQVGEDAYLVEDPTRPTADDFLNHSCEPNAGFLDGSLVLYALFDIEPGDEILFDYSTAMNEPGWSFACRCRSRRCRREVESYCDLPRPVRTRLRPISLAYLRA